MTPRIICVRREQADGTLSPCTRHAVGYGAELAGMERCPTCNFPLHRLPHQSGFWTIIDELLAGGPQGPHDARSYTLSAVEFYFASHPHWRQPLIWSWLEILRDERQHPDKFRWRVAVNGDLVFFVPKEGHRPDGS